MKREEKVKNQFLWKETQKKRKGFLVISFSLPFHLTWDEAATWYARYNARCTKICHQSAALKVPPEKYMAFFIFIFLTNIRVHPQHFLWAQYPIFLLSFYVLLFMTDDDCFFFSVPSFLSTMLMGAHWPHSFRIIFRCNHCRDKNVKTFSLPFLSFFFFSFVFSNHRFFLPFFLKPAPETIYPQISGSPGPELHVAWFWGRLQKLFFTPF